MRTLFRSIVMFLALGAMVQTAMAANVMFQAERACVTCMVQPYQGAVRPSTVYGGPNPNGPSAILEATAGGDFEIASQAWVNPWGVPFTFSATFPGYPYFVGAATKYWGQINGTVGRHTATATISLSNYSSTYPAITATADKGFVRIIPGPQEFGGDVLTFRRTQYTGTVAVAAGGFSDFTAYVNLPKVSPSVIHPSANFSRRQNQTDPTNIYNANVARAVRMQAVTGRVEWSMPAPITTRAGSITGYDNRNGAGTTGTIQLVQAGISSTWQMTNPIPPRDGTGNIVRRVMGLASAFTFTLTLLPEPGQLALLVAGVAGLGVIVRRRR